MSALATGGQMGWDGINLHLEHLATALMKEITVARPSTTSHDQQCSHMQHFRIVGESMILFESISWGAALLTLTGKKICSKPRQSQTSTRNSETDHPHLHNFSPLSLRRCQNDPAIKTLSISKITCQLRNNTLQLANMRHMRPRS